MQIIMSVIYSAMLTGMVIWCTFSYIDGSLKLVFFIILLVLAALICLPFPIYFIYVRTKYKVKLSALKNAEAVRGKIMGIEAHPFRYLARFFARLEIKRDCGVYYTQYLYYTNGVKNLRGQYVEFVCDEKTTYVTRFGKKDK